MPKDERDKIIAARKTACEAKKKGGGGKGGDGGKGKGKATHKKSPMQAKWTKKLITHQVAKALTVREKEDDDDDKEVIPMK
jgi:hypothetical protein